MSASNASILLAVEEDKAPQATRSARSTVPQYPPIAPRGIGAHSSTRTAAPMAIAASAEKPASPPASPSAPANAAAAPSGVGQRSADGGSSGNGRRRAAARAAVGSDEWQRMRKESHKEVERRRRECINEGISTLATLIPGAEKNKGKILQQAVAYIHRLKATEAKNIEKWTIEKLIADQAISELTSQAEHLKAENEQLRRRLKESGVEVESVPRGGDVAASEAVRRTMADAARSAAAAADACAADAGAPSRRQQGKRQRKT